ncbi:MAG: hypothetical protein FD153_145, partial [Rhodospirillaceae bacterium]
RPGTGSRRESIKEEGRKSSAWNSRPSPIKGEGVFPPGGEGLSAKEAGVSFGTGTFGRGSRGGHEALRRMLLAPSLPDFSIAIPAS